MLKSNTGIGTKRESSLHRSLKFQYSELDIEVPVGDYVCDGKTSQGELIEVQTGSFGPLREKVKILTRKNRVRIVHPIVYEKYIELYDINGGLIHRRKSPRRGSDWDLFKALLYAPELPLLKNLVLELVVIDVVEKRIDDGSGSWRRKGVRIADRLLGARRESVFLKKPGDYYRFIPFKKKEVFTVRNLAEKAGINATLAKKTIYVLGKMGLVERAGKRGRAFIYQRTKKAGL